MEIDQKSILENLPDKPTPDINQQTSSAGTDAFCDLTNLFGDGFMRFLNSFKPYETIGPNYESELQ